MAMSACPLQRQCSDILSGLVHDVPLFEMLLDEEYNKCYSGCEDGLRIDGRARPTSCARLGVRVEPNRAAARGIFGWNKVYHGTKKDFVGSIVKLGYLLKYGDQTSDGQEIGSRDIEKIACGDGKYTHRVKIREGRAVKFDATMAFVPKEFVFSSPSFKYACHDAYAEPFDRGNKIILEFRLKQETFLPGPQTVTNTVEDLCVDQNSFEYFTARHGVMVNTGIIVKPAVPKTCTCKCWKLSVPRQPVMNTVSLSCPNAQRRWKVLLHIGINPLYFNHAYDRCYCGCEKLPDCVQQEGGRKYVLPKPGTRFSLHLDEARNEVWGCFAGWDTCFHGTTFAALSQVVECGYLLYPGCVSVYGKEITERDHSADGSRTVNRDIPTNTICVSPSIRYASHPVYAQPLRLGGHKYRVVLQFKIRPDAYRACRSTLKGLPADFDPYVKLSEMEWHTRRHGTLVLYGIVLHDEAI